MDGSAVGRGSAVLVVGVVYAGLALSVAWLIIRGNKGHFTQQRHLELLAQLSSLIAPGVRVTFLGDGEFDGTLLQEQLALLGWRYVVRTAKNTQLLVRDASSWPSYQQLGLTKGQNVGLAGVGFSGEGYGSLLAIGHWQSSFEELLYLITNLDSVEAALELYKRRYHIETIFSDYKSRGFGLQSSHLSDPARLQRLLIGCALAYWWLTYLGVTAHKKGLDQLISRPDRCEVSFFQLGWRFMEELLNRGRLIPCQLLKLPAAYHF